MKGRWVRERGDSDQLAAAAKSLLVHLGVTYDDATVEADLVEAPDYPSPGALEAALLRWGVNSAAIRVEADDLADLPVPCVALGRERRYLVVTAIEADRGAEVIDTRTGPARLDWAALREIWTGVAIAAEPNEGATATSESGRATLAARSWRKRTLVALGLVTVAAMGASIGVRQLPLFLCDLLGLGVSGLLMLAGSGEPSFVRRMCTLGPRMSCAGVLASRASRIGPVAMTDIGIVYFSGGLLVQAATALTGDAALGWSRALLALAAVGYTLFSIGYQAVLRLFCPLCLAVQAVLLAEAGLLATTALQPVALHDRALLALGLAWLVPALLWALLRPLVAAGLRLPSTARALRRLTRDPARIAALLEATPASDLPAGPFQILDGDPTAPTIITVYTDLRCHVCAQTHPELSALVGRGGLCVRYRLFAFFPPDERSTEMIGRLCDLVAAGDEEGAREALEAWYASGRIAAGPASRSEPSRALEAAHHAWATSRSFPVAPMIYVGNRLLPEHVAVPDLAYFIERRADVATD